MRHRICLFLLVLSCSVASGDRVVPLHAPVAAISGDGKLAYTSMFRATNFYFEIYHLDTGKIEFATMNDDIGKIDITDPKTFNSTDTYYFQQALKAFKEGDTTDQAYIQANSSLTLLFADRQFFSGKPIYYSHKFDTWPPLYDGSWNKDTNYIVSADTTTFSYYSISPFKKLAAIQIGPDTSDDPVGVPDFLTVRISPDHRTLVLGSYSSLRVFKIDFKHLPTTSAELNRGLVYDDWANVGKAPVTLLNLAADSLSISPDSQVVAGGYAVYRIFSQVNDGLRFGWIRSLKTGKYLAKFWDQAPGIVKTAFSPDGRYLATLGGISEEAFCANAPRRGGMQVGDGSVFLRDAHTGKVLKKYPGACYGLHFSPDSKTMLFSDIKYNLHIVDLP